MAGDFETPAPAKLGDPADKTPALAHRSGYAAVTVEGVLARVVKWEGHGLTPAEVRVLAAEVVTLRKVERTLRDTCTVYHHRADGSRAEVESTTELRELAEAEA